MRLIRGYIDQTEVYRPHTKATIFLLLIHIIDKYKENLAGIFVQGCNF
jgi:hypothetical protein